MSRKKRISVGYINPAPRGRSWGDYSVTHNPGRVTLEGPRRGVRVELFAGKYTDFKQLAYVHPLQERYHYNASYQDNIYEVLDRGKMAWNGVARVDCSKLESSPLISLMRGGCSSYSRVFDFRNLGKTTPETFARRIVEFYSALLKQPSYPSPYAGLQLEYWLPIRIHVPAGKEAYIAAVERQFESAFAITNSDGGRGFMLESSIFLGEPPSDAADRSTTAGAGAHRAKPKSVKPPAKEVITIAKGKDLYKPEVIALHTRDLTSAMMQLQITLKILFSNRMKSHVRDVLDALCVALDMRQRSAISLSRFGAAETALPHIKWKGDESADVVTKRLEIMLAALHDLPVERLAHVQDVLRGVVNLPGTELERQFYRTAPIHLVTLIEDLRREKAAAVALAPPRRDVAVPVAPPSSVPRSVVGDDDDDDDFKLYETPATAPEMPAAEDGVGELAALGDVAYTAIYPVEYLDQGGVAQTHLVRISVVQGDMADQFMRPGVAAVNLVNETGTDPQGGKYAFVPRSLEKWVRQKDLSGVAESARDTIPAEHLAAITAIEQQTFKATGQRCYTQGDMMAFRLQNAGQEDSLLVSEYPPIFKGVEFSGDKAAFYQRTQYRLMEMARLRQFRKFASPIASTGNHGLNIKQGAKAMAHAYKAQMDSHPCAFDEIAIVVRADKDNSPQRVLAAADQISDIFGVSLVPTKKGVLVTNPDEIIPGGAVYERAYTCPPPAARPTVARPTAVAHTTAVRMHKPTKSLKQRQAEARRDKKAAEAREKAQRDQWKGYGGGAGGGGNCKVM
ncbi:MAG: hypothetical protein P1U34_03410 [Coxiellaceae bacterium]|nr:hypothetical protein [Coxiellaceae bacterium]